jgi:hypothetical protein
MSSNHETNEANSYNGSDHGITTEDDTVGRTSHDIRYQTKSRHYQYINFWMTEESKHVLK